MGGKLVHRGAKEIATLLVIAELVEGSTGRRQQHHRCRGAGGLRVLQGGSSRSRQRAAKRMRNLPERPRERLRRLADEIGFADARKERHETFDAALFCT